MRKLILGAVCVWMLVLFTGSLRAQESTSPNYQPVDEYGGILVDTAFNNDETLLLVALPFRIEFYDLTADDLPLIDTLELPNITHIGVRGNRLAVAHRSNNGIFQEISLFDLDTRREKVLFFQMQHLNDVSALEFSPDSTRLAVTADHKLWIVEEEKFTDIHRVALPVAPELRLQWSDDNRYVALNSNQLIVHDTQTGVTVQTGLAISGEGPSGLVYHEGRFAVYQLDSEVFGICDMATFEVKEYEIEVENEAQLRDVELSPTLDTVSFTIGRDVYIVPIPEDSGVISPDDALEDVDISPEDSLLDIVSTATGQEATTYNTVISPSETLALIHYRVGEVYSNFSEAIDIVDLRDQQVRRLDRVFTLELSGFWEVDDVTANVWSSCGMLNIDFSTSPVIADYESGCGEIYGICGLIGTAFIVEAEYCGGPGEAMNIPINMTVRRLDDNGDPTGDALELIGHTEPLAEFIFLQDGRRLLTRGWDGNAILWTFLNDAGELELVEQQNFRLERGLRDADVSPDSQLMALVNSDGEVHLYDINTASGTYREVVQWLDTMSNLRRSYEGGGVVRFSENVLYTLSGGRVIRWQMTEPES